MRDATHLNNAQNKVKKHFHFSNACTKMKLDIYIIFRSTNRKIENIYSTPFIQKSKGI